MLADYAQLEAAWISAGGPRAEAPLAAAIAIAESHPPGDVTHANTDAINPNDNNGTQSSFGAWQISNGTHIPPAGNWNSLSVNASLAVGKWKGAGNSFSPWGTFTSGAWHQFFHGNIAPGNISTAAFHLPNPLNIPGDIGHVFSGLWGDITGGFGVLSSIGHAFSDIGHVFENIANPQWWERVGKGAIGGALVITGGILIFRETETYEKVKTEAVKAGKEAAVAAK